MGDRYAECPGGTVQQSDLRLRRSLSFLRALSESPCDTIVDCRVFDENSTYREIVVIDVGVERPQKTTFDIRLTERIAVEFLEADSSQPEVLALRKSFPQVPHLNLRMSDQPKSLCLYADDWNDQRLRWNGKAFLERIREWLTLTARGQLHQDDQPLEPLMFNSGYRIVISHGANGDKEDCPVPLAIVSYGPGAHEHVLIACDPAQEKDVRPEQKHLMLRITTPAVPHGVIHNIPQNLKDLAKLTDRIGFSLLAVLQEKLKALSNDALKQRRFVLLVDFPKTRAVGGPVETIERKAFLSSDLVSTVGEKLGVWKEHEGTFGVLLGDLTGHDGAGVDLVAVMDVTETCSWDMLALLNGETERTRLKILAVGAGALGSQIACNLARSGFGEWTIVDEDTFLPHNAARHAMTALFTGCRKAHAVSSEMNAFADDEPLAEALPIDVLRPGAQESTMEGAIENAHLILDMSASVSVARKLCDNNSDRRVISFFLNPSGQDLVALAEDAERTCPLNDLEMNYYWAAATHPDLDDHLGGAASSHVRYGTSCRDVSSRVPQDFVALHAANGARAMRKLASSAEASTTVYRYDPGKCSLRAVAVPVEVMYSCVVGEWHVRVLPDVVRKLIRSRREALPEETGGVLVGGVDFDRSVVYVVGVLPAPDDSVQFPDGFIRGSKLLAKHLGEIERRTSGNLSYIGEWHSHPNRVGTMASASDKTLFEWICGNTVYDGRPAVMMIAGQRGVCRIFAGSLTPNKTLKWRNQ